MTEEEIQHYFDWAATGVPDKDILEKDLSLSFSAWANPSSIHKLGKEAHNLLNKARAICAKALNVKKETLYFTSGGTESDHIPLLSMLTRPIKGTILISSIEHPAIREQAKALKNNGWNVKNIPCTKTGFITPEAVINNLTNDTVLVCVMAVNNETGAIQDIEQISNILTEKCKGKRRPHFHVDCVQAAGKIPFDLNIPGINSAAFSAHKIGGPRGIGLLYLENPIEPFLRGGGQESNIRSGTENIFGALCFSDCLRKYLITEENISMKNRFEKQKELTKKFIKNILTLKNCTILPQERTENLYTDRFSPWIVQASFENIPGQVMVRALDAKGFYISTGSACSAKKQNRPILEAMKISLEQRNTAVRISFGIPTTEDSINNLFSAIQEICTTFAN